MNTYLKSVVEECVRGSEKNLLSFPQVLGKLTEVGVEGYYADLRHATKTFYLPNGESIEVDAAGVDVPVADALSAAGVEEAIRQSQISYRTFCEKVMASGCSSYFVSLLGRRVVYFGRRGETHVEHFPAVD